MGALHLFIDQVQKVQDDGRGELLGLNDWLNQKHYVRRLKREEQILIDDQRNSLPWDENPT